MKLKSLYPVIMTDTVQQVADFYTQVLGFEVVFAAPWYISLIHAASRFEIAVLDRRHETVPAGFGQPAQGMIVNLEVEDADAVYQDVIVRRGLAPVLDIRDEAFGQRHFMLADPAGVLVDIIQVIAPSAQYADAYLQNR